LFLSTTFILQVIRQDEALLITAVNELAVGKLSTQSTAFLQSLSRPLHAPPAKKHVLFADNAQSDDYNHIQLNLMEGEATTFLATDEGTEEDLAKVPVKKVLTK
jgi:hypothetical protein